MLREREQLAVAVRQLVQLAAGGGEREAAQSTPEISLLNPLLVVGPLLNPLIESKRWTNLISVHLKMTK